MTFSTLIRLTALPDHPDGRAWRLDGRLDARTLHALDALDPSAPVTLDLSGLTGLDGEGRRRLEALRRAGCRLVGASLYVGTLLET